MSDQIYSATDEYRARLAARYGIPDVPLTDVQRAARYRARKRGEDIPQRRPGRKPAAGWFAYGEQAGRSLAQEIVKQQPMRWVEALKLLGLDTDQQRVRDRVDAARARAKNDRDETRRRIEALASAVKKARRNADLAHSDWKGQPTKANLDRVTEANRARGLLEAELRAACLDDMALVADVLRWADGR